MIDFKLTSNGDIDIADAYQYPCFTIYFTVPTVSHKKDEEGNTVATRRFPALRLDFDTDIPRYRQRQGGCLLTFHTDLHPEHVQQSTLPVREDRETAQAIAIRFKTELGEFSRLPGLGSELVQVRHEDIKSEATVQQARTHAQSALWDMDLPEKTTVSVERIDDPSRFRYETLQITVDTGGVNSYETTI